MSNRELLMLAKDYDPDQHNIGGMYVSLKLDGTRAFWDGGISTGIRKEDVPWANTTKPEHISTGLWSRYGNVIHAPNWFIAKLPKGIMLDGELYLGRGQFSESRSIVSTYTPDERWKKIKYRVFEMPSPNAVFSDGQVKGSNFTRYIDGNACEAFLHKHMSAAVRVSNQNREVMTFRKTIERMRNLNEVQNDVWSFLNQAHLPVDEEIARNELHTLLNRETDRGGEGLILRSPTSIWVPKRVVTLLKVKSYNEDSGTVVGYIAGKEGKEGRLLGKLGALRVEWKGKRFNMSGFKMEERELTADGALWCSNNPGELYPGSYSICPLFPLGSSVRFRYMTLTNEGIPREPRFFR